MSKHNHFLYISILLLSSLIFGALFWAIIGSQRVLDYSRVLFVFITLHVFFFYLESKIRFTKVVFLPFLFLVSIALFLFVGAIIYSLLNLGDGFVEAIAFTFGFLVLVLAMFSFLVTYVYYKQIISQKIVFADTLPLIVNIFVFMVLFITFQYGNILWNMSGIDISLNYYLLLIVGSFLICLPFTFVLRSQRVYFKLFLIIVPFTYVFLFNITTFNGISILLLSSITFLFFSLFPKNRILIH